MDEQELQRAMESFIASLAQPSIPHWDALPDLDLYMDQVIAFMEKYLSLFGDSRDKLITPSMINNYVKLGVLPPPVKKKYNREHLARLMTICMLKQVLPIPVLAHLNDRIAAHSSLSTVFDQFVDEQCAALQSVSQTAQTDVAALAGEHMSEGLAQLVAAQANACRVLAEKTALLLLEQQQGEKPHKKS